MQSKYRRVSLLQVWAIFSQLYFWSEGQLENLGGNFSSSDDNHTLNTASGSLLPVQSPGLWSLCLRISKNELHFACKQPKTARCFCTVTFLLVFSGIQAVYSVFYRLIYTYFSLSTLGSMPLHSCRRWLRVQLDWFPGDRQGFSGPGWMCPGTRLVNHRIWHIRQTTTERGYLEPLVRASARSPVSASRYQWVSRMRKRGTDEAASAFFSFTRASSQGLGVTVTTLNV